MKLIKNIFLLFIIFSVNSVYAVDHNSSTCDKVELSFYDSSNPNHIEVEYKRSYDINLHWNIYTTDNHLIHFNHSIPSWCDDTILACDENINRLDWFFLIQDLDQIN